MSTLTHLRSSYDAVVVGARCAGAATALLLARQGLKVLAVERGRYGSDTLSTHALMRGGVLQLHRWGVLDRLLDAGTPAVRRTAFHYGGETIDIPIKPRDGVEGLYAPRRSVLDTLLVDVAVEDGVDAVHHVRLVDLVRSADGRVGGVIVEGPEGDARRIAAGTVVGADGRQSTVARLVGAEAYRRGRHASGVVYGYWSGLDVEGYHWYYGRGVSVGVIPTNDGQVCVFASVPSRRFDDEIRQDIGSGFFRILRECEPELVRSLSRAGQVGGFRGFAGAPGFLRRAHGPGWALVGDAGYFKDPITAHGMTDALRDAELLALAVAEGSDVAMEGYQSLRDELSLGLFDVTDEIASFEWDLPAVQQLHLRLSEEMNREVRLIGQLESGARLTA